MEGHLGRPLQDQLSDRRRGRPQTFGYCSVAQTGSPRLRRSAREIRTTLRSRDQPQQLVTWRSTTSKHHDARSIAASDASQSSDGHWFNGSEASRHSAVDWSSSSDSSRQAYSVSSIFLPPVRSAFCPPDRSERRAPNDLGPMTNDSAPGCQATLSRRSQPKDKTTLPHNTPFTRFPELKITDLRNNQTGILSEACQFESVPCRDQLSG